MKTNKCILFLLLVLGVYSCTESEFNQDESASLIARYLTSSESHINFGAKASSRNIQISTINTAWKINNSSSWLTVSPAQGTSSASVVIDTEENTSGDIARTQIIMLESADMDWQYTFPISVTQSAASPYITPDEKSIELPGRAGRYRMHVASNTDWHPSCDYSFLRANRDGDYLVLEIDENKDLENGRRAEVLLVGSTTASLVVVQSPSGIKAETDSLFFDNIAASYTLSVESDLPWTATTSYSWIQVSPNSGNVGSSELTISVTRNASTSSRKGSVYLSISGKSIKVPVYQRGYFAEIDTNCIEFGSHGGAMEVSLSTNDSWKASLSNCDWLTITPKEGSSSSPILLNALDNATATPRSTSLSIHSTYSGNIIVDIIQNGRYLRSSVEAISFFSKGGVSEPIHISSDAKYEVTKLGDWFTLSESNNLLRVSSEVNNSGAWREGRIILKATDLVQGELVVSIPVIQAIEGTTFAKETYKADINYNLLNSYGLSIVIKTYNSNINYNESGIDGIIKDNYKKENNYDESGIEGMIKENYKKENDYDENLQ